MNAPSSSSFTLVVADERPLICEGLAALCRGFTGCNVLGCCTHGDEAWSMVEHIQPDLALLGYELPRLPTAEIVRRSRSVGLRTRFVLLADRANRREALESLRGGASGFVLRSSTRIELEESFRKVGAGAIFVSQLIDWQHSEPVAVRDPVNPLRSLSARELQVFGLLVEGVRARDIAARLSLSPKTVDTYRASLMRKLAIHDIPGLVKLAILHKVTAAGA